MDKNHDINSAWSDMHDLLDKELPQKKRRKRILWIFYCLLGIWAGYQSVQSWKTEESNQVIADVSKENQASNLLSSSTNNLSVRLPQERLHVTENRSKDENQNIGTAKRSQSRQLSNSNTASTNSFERAQIAKTITELTDIQETSNSESNTTKTISTQSYLPTLKTLLDYTNRLAITNNITSINPIKDDKMRLEAFIETGFADELNSPVHHLYIGSQFLFKFNNRINPFFAFSYQKSHSSKLHNYETPYSYSEDILEMTPLGSSISTQYTNSHIVNIGTGANFLLNKKFSFDIGVNYWVFLNNNIETIVGSPGQSAETNIKYQEDIEVDKRLKNQFLSFFRFNYQVFNKSSFHIGIERGFKSWHVTNPKLKSPMFLKLGFIYKLSE